MEARLRPIQGERFQPTGFADLGAAIYDSPRGGRTCLVESAQSVANRLEAAVIDGVDIIPNLQGLPYIKAQLTGASDVETTSLVEAHRINSPFIITDKAFQADFADRSGYAKGRRMQWDKVASALLHYDINALLHGVFMANLGDGRLRVPRAITGFIEATGVREAASGGVKNNDFDPSGQIRVESHPKDVYSNVPYQRTEYTAESITAFFNLDLALLRGHRLPEVATQLLIDLALLKVQRFLHAGLRLRTACDLDVVGELTATRPEGLALPSSDLLLKSVQAGIAACTADELFAAPPVTVLGVPTIVKAASKG
jgi:CRISPR-associated protein Csb1